MKGELEFINSKENGFINSKENGEGELFRGGQKFTINKIKLPSEIAREGFEPPTSGLWALRALQTAPPRYIF